jgi:hypothetical protein
MHLGLYSSHMGQKANLHTEATCAGGRCLPQAVKGRRWQPCHAICCWEGRMPLVGLEATPEPLAELARQHVFLLVADSLHGTEVSEATCSRQTQVAPSGVPGCGAVQAANGRYAGIAHAQAVLQPSARPSMFYLCTSMLYCCFQLVLLCFSSACFWCFAVLSMLKCTFGFAFCPVAVYTMILCSCRPL